MKVAENRNKKHQEETFLDAFFSSFRKKDNAITDIAPYKRTTKEGYLIDEEDNYQAFLKVKTTDLVSLNPDDLNRIIHQLTDICRIYTENLKILALTYSTETTEQQMYWKSKINKYRRIISSNTGNVQRHETMLKLALDNFRRVSWVEDNLSELTFFMVVYGMNEKEINTRVRDILRLGGKQFSLKQVDEKNIEKVVFRLTNMNTDL
ncbi:hypothetical protein [Virgibacillus halodenitrificans]|uniref:hypothetical protein n=1 Tax=Virgibacillus halodenitrificans TaxID=1482 RepID=UPI00045C4AA5|nr:hypothetical protein [Virgibacillus halodenitrificans]CDQ37713.1 hypothetical protein BN993_07275 [Virgibacillus halodenitrificans]